MSILDTWRRDRWTLHDLVDLEMPRWLESCRFEVVDGALVVTPPPKIGHLRPRASLLNQLQRQVPGGWSVMTEVDVLIGADGDFRRPDVVVLRPFTDLDDLQEGMPSRYVALVVEVESPSSVRTDRVAKTREYAGEGIAAYWRIERDPLVLVAHDLVDGSYVEVARVDGGVVRLGEWTVDVDGLRSRRM